MFLVDTNVISATAPTQREKREVLAAWMDRHSDSLFLSVVTVAEVVDGIEKARRTGAVRKADHLTAWIDTVIHLYSERILAFDVAVARIAGELSDRARGRGRAPGLADLVIAATASHHELTILTRNTIDFVNLGVRVHDPFSTLPR